MTKLLDQEVSVLFTDTRNGKQWRESMTAWDYIKAKYPWYVTAVKDENFIPCF